MDIFQQILQLHMPSDEFVVVGSGTLAALGLRPPRDIDLLVSNNVYHGFKTAGWAEHIYPTTKDTGLSQGDFEVVTNWHGIRLQDLLGSALWMEGIAFAHLDDVARWKTAMGRQKDLEDLNLIKAYHCGQKTMALA